MARNIRRRRRPAPFAAVSSGCREVPNQAAGFWRRARGARGASGVSRKGLRRFSGATLAGADVFNYVCNVMCQQFYIARGMLFFSFRDLTGHYLCGVGGFGDIISRKKKKKKSVLGSMRFL